MNAKNVNDYIAGDTGDGVLSPSTYMQNKKRKLLPTYNDPLPGAQFAESTYRVGTSMPGDFGKYPELERGILLSDIAESPAYLNQLRGQAQDWTDQLANAVVGGVKSGLLTTVEDMSYIGDLNTYKSLFQMESASSNWLADWAKQQKDQIAQERPIFAESNQALDMTDSATYYNLLKSAIDSGVGFGITGGLVGKAVGSAAKLARLKGLLSTAGEGIATMLGTGTIQNIAEGKMVAMEAFDQGKRQIDAEANALRMERMQAAQDALQKVLGQVPPTLVNVGTQENPSYQSYVGDKPLAQFEKEYLDNWRNSTEQEIKKIYDPKIKALGDEASKIEAKNLAFLLSDVAQVRGLLKGVEGVTRAKPIESLTKRFLEPFTSVKSFGKAAASAIGEGAEEVGQEVIKNEGVTKALNPNEIANTSFTARMYDYLQDPQVKEAFLGGLVGGPIQESMTNLTGGVGDLFRREDIKKYNNDLAVKQAEANQANREFINSRMQFTAQKNKEKQDAILAGDEAKVAEIDKDLFSNLVYSNAKNQNVHNLEQNLKDLSTSKDASEEERMKATELLQQLPKFEKEFIKATEASTVTDKDGTRKVDELKRANLFSLATRIESTKEAAKTIDEQLNGFNSEAAKVTAKEAEIKRLENLRGTAEKIDNFLTTPEGNVDAFKKTMAVAGLPMLLSTIGGGILGSAVGGDIGAMAGATSAATASGGAMAYVISSLMDKNLTTKKVDSLIAKKQSELEVLKSNLTGKKEELSAKDKLDVEALASKRAELETLNKHYNDVYSALKTNKKNLSEQQALLLAKLNSSNADPNTVAKVDSVLKDYGIRQETAVDTKKPTEETVAQSDVQLEALAKKYVREGRSIETEEEAQVISANPEKFQEFIDKANQEVEDENIYQQEGDEVKNILLNSLGERSKLDENDVNDFVEASKDKGVDNVVSHLNNLRRDVLEGNLPLPETTTEEDLMDSIDMLLKGLNLEPQEPISKAYENVNHWDDYKRENELDARKNNSEGFQENRKLKTVNAVAYNGTNPNPSEVAFARYVQDPKNNLVGQRVEYLVPEQVGMFSPEEMRAWTMVQDKSWNKSKANRDYVMQNLPIQIRLENGLTSWLHKPSYEGYSDDPTFRKALNDFNSTIRPAIITGLLTGKKVSTTIKNQRPGYGNFQFWYGNPKDRTVVNTQNSEEMAKFRRELATNGKVKRTPMHNRINTVVDKVELSVADKNGSIGPNSGKTAGRIYFKVRKGNGEIGWAPAYVRSINDRIELIQLMKENPAEALVKFEDDMNLIAKLTGKPADTLTEKDVLKVLVEEPSKVYSMSATEAKEYLTGKRTAVDANRLSDPRYVEFLTQGSDPILYTNMARYDNNGVTALFVQPTIELDTAFSINETMTINPIVSEELSDVEYQSVVEEQINRMGIQDAALKADVRINLLSMNREQLAEVNKHFKNLGNPKATLREIDTAVRELSKVFTKPIDSKVPAGAFFSNYKNSPEDKEAIAKRFKPLAKDFDKLIELTSYFNENKPVETLLNNSVQNTTSTEKVAVTEQNQPISVSPEVVDSLAFEGVISGNPLGAVIGEDEQSVSIRNQLNNPTSELTRAVNLRMEGLRAKMKELGISNSTAKVLLSRNEDMSEQFMKLKSALITTDKPLTDNGEKYLRDEIVDRIEDADMKQALNNLSEVEFNQVMQDVLEGKAVKPEPSKVTTIDELAKVQPLETETLLAKVILHSDDVMKALEANTVQDFDTTGLEGEAKELADKFIATEVKSYSDYLFKVQLANKLLSMPEADWFNIGMLDYLNSFSLIENPVQNRTMSLALNQILGIDYTMDKSIIEVLGELTEETSMKDVAERLRKFLPDVSNQTYSGSIRKSSEVNAVVTDEFQNGLDANANPTFAPAVWKGSELLLIQGVRDGKAVYAVSTEENKSNLAKDQRIQVANPTVVFSAEYKSKMSAKPESVEANPVSADTTVDKTISENVNVDRVQYKGLEFKVFEENGKLYAQVEGKAKQVIPKAVHSVLLDKLVELNDKMCK